MPNNKNHPNKRILVTGANGLVGTALCKRLIQAGWSLVVLGRKTFAQFEDNFSLPCEYHQWSAPTQEPPPEAALNVAAVIHLMGESIADKRWSDKQKKTLIESRTLTTRNLVAALKKQSTMPEVFISASAIGIYGDRGNDLLTENSRPANDFLGKLCQDWEAEAHAAPCRSVQVRIGVVLAQQGGALAKMQAIFENGLGGKLGSGQQWMSWIHLEDLVEVFIYCLNNKNISGSINATAPNPVSNQDFTKKIAQALKVSALLPAPKIALQIVLGEMSQILLASQRVQAEKLIASGFQFKYKSLDKAFAAIYDWKESKYDRLLHNEQWVSLPREKIFEFFSDEKNLEILTPEFLQFKVLSKSTENLEEGTEIKYQLKIYGIPAKWKSKICCWQKDSQFKDIQITGPYAKWLHTHGFEDLGQGTLLTDQVVYRLPLAKWGANLGLPLVKKDIQNIFNYRRKKIKKLFSVRS